MDWSLILGIGGGSMDEGSPSNEGQATWRPRELAFRPYLLRNENQGLRVVVGKPVSLFSFVFVD